MQTRLTVIDDEELELEEEELDVKRDEDEDDEDDEDDGCLKSNPVSSVFVV